MLDIFNSEGQKMAQVPHYEGLFNCLATRENLRLVAKRPVIAKMAWSFVVYPPDRAASIYARSKAPCAALVEAYACKLPLIEICTGDYENPQYIAVTSQVDLVALKKSWCLAYCEAHQLEIHDGFEGLLASKGGKQ